VRVTPSPASRNPFLGAGDATTRPKNIFHFYSKNPFKYFHIAKQIKKIKLLHYGYCEL
jgi:hypothetical protein